MIRITNRFDLERQLSDAIAAPDRYRQIILCSPFVGGSVSRLIGRLAAAVGQVRCGLVVMTRAETVAVLSLGEFRVTADWSDIVTTIPVLHAKAYLFVGRDPKDTRAIITSANLTGPGLFKNVELGVVASPTSDGGRRVISETRSFLKRLVDKATLSRVRQKSRRFDG